MKTKSYYKFSVLIFLIAINLSDSFSQIPLEGLIGYYMFDNNTKDSSGLEHHGNIIGNVDYTQGHNGNDNSALLLSGGYLDLGNPLGFQMTDSISISVWIKPSEINSWQAIVTKWDNFDSGGYYLGINPDGNLIRWNIDMPNPVEGNSVQINEWLHIVATHDGNTTKLYMDGQLVSQEIFEQQIIDNDANVYIGSQYNIPNEFTFKGAIDDVLIYNRALNQNEVTNIFNFIPTSIFSLQNSTHNITLYPNPTDGILYIENNSKLENILFTIIDSQGKNVLKSVSNQNRIDLTFLIPGNYFILLYVDNKIVSKKIILK